jgi:hypothetical protein
MQMPPSLAAAYQHIIILDAMQGMLAGGFCKA